MDATCRTFFCAKQKNASNAKAYRVEDIVDAHRARVEGARVDQPKELRQRMHDAWPEAALR